MQLVKEGKLSPEDAAELIEAFQEAPDPSADEPRREAEKEEGVPVDGPPKSTRNDAFSRFIGSIESVAKEVSTNVNWKDIADTVRTGVEKGVDAVKGAAEDARKHKGPFANIVFGTRIGKTVDLPLQVPEGKKLVVETGSGDVFIEGGHPVGSIKIEATFSAFNEEEAQAACDRYTPSIEESDEAITFRNNQNNVATDLTIKVAEGTPVVVRIASGDVVCAATNESVRVDAASGDIRVTKAKGLVEVNTASGDVKVSDCQAKNLKVESKSGDVILDKVEAAANVRTTSGDITVYSFQGSNMSAEAASGDVLVDFAGPVDYPVNVRTVSGSATLHVPDGSSVRVNLSTLRGDVKCQLPIQGGVVEQMKVTGQTGEGAGTIDVSTVNGDVFVGLRELVEED